MSGGNLLAVIGMIGVAGTFDVELIGADRQAEQILQCLVDH